MFEKAREVASPPSLSLSFAVLTYRFSKQECDDFMARLKMPNAVSRVIWDTARLRERLPSLESPSVLPSTVHGLLRQYCLTSVQACAIAADSALVRERLGMYLTRWRHVRTALDGDALQKLGVRSGPEMGEMLKSLQDAKLDGRIDSREDEVELVQRWLSHGR